MLRFFPIPDPWFPETMTRENVQKAQQLGVWYPNGQIYAAANLEMFGEDSKGGNLETLPAGLGYKKFWADRFNHPETYVFFDRGPNIDGPAIRSIEVSPRQDIAGGFSDPSFNIYQQNLAGRAYREFAELINAWGGVPALREYKLAFTPEEYGKLCFLGGDRAFPFPLKPRPEDGTGFGELILRFNPDRGHVEAFSVQNLNEEIRAGRFNVADEIARALKVRKERMDRLNEGAAVVITGPGTIEFKNPPAFGTNPPPVTLTPTAPAAPPALEGVIEVEGLGFNTSTGEAICNGIQTGLFFERVVQALPVPGENPDTSRGLQYLPPWNYATAKTAKLIVDLISTLLPGYTFSIAFGDRNAAFPTSILPRELAVEIGSEQVRILNLGQLASQIARTVANVSDGRGGTMQVKSMSPVSNAVPSIMAAINEAQRKASL